VPGLRGAPTDGTWLDGAYVAAQGDGSRSCSQLKGGGGTVQCSGSHVAGHPGQATKLRYQDLGSNGVNWKADREGPSNDAADEILLAFRPTTKQSETQTCAALSVALLSVDVLVVHPPRAPNRTGHRSIQAQIRAQPMSRSGWAMPSRRSQWMELANEIPWWSTRTWCFGWYVQQEPQHKLVHHLGLEDCGASI
jgi:hypothetical protein